MLIHTDPSDTSIIAAPIIMPSRLAALFVFASTYPIKNDATLKMN
ncbi:hypothetical protein CJA_0950 [Cellvibrio japonicus Ueda107]|uniref:Uncharacterized protein n=1 Tax=Cellvibrio japonicus (strain Ueda107) TaxID=498211 RepID=B3PLC6_CELJU|nr:hypothetical protein CJA_0950 [Cellvibrio japonicus Ueda107]